MRYLCSILVLLVSFNVCSIGRANGVQKEWQSTSLYDLLSEQAVGEKLVLSDEQREELSVSDNEVEGEIVKKLQRAMFTITDPTARADKAKEIIASRHDLEEERLKQILLAHQLELLKAVWRQREIDRRGLADVLVNAKAALKLSDEQVEDLRSLEDSSREEREVTLRRLKKEAEDRFLGTLTESQRQEWTRLLGKTTDIPKEEE
ncbi:MAG: hypothetical protein KDB27_01005 [Planctomycetales bacterium]|nr:hypothetical protein [Planctomycetales bacterium]